MITVNIDKAKVISHDKRREARAKEFAPHDDVIAKQIPGADAVAAEAARQAIRVKYADVQVRIDAATDADVLKAILVEIGAVDATAPVVAPSNEPAPADGGTQ